MVAGGCTVRDRAGAMMTVCPDRARCPGCQVTHVVLDAALLPRRAYSAALTGQALVASTRGSGRRRIALDLDVPAGTVRGWIRGARRSAAGLRVIGIRAAACDQDAEPALLHGHRLSRRNRPVATVSSRHVPVGGALIAAVRNVIAQRRAASPAIGVTQPGVGRL